MKSSIIHFGILAVVVAVIGACATLQPLPLLPLPPNAEVPKLTGSWEGSWTAHGTVHPITLNIAEQKDGRVSGTITVIGPLSGQATPMTGTLGLRDGKTVLLVTVARYTTTDEFRFTVVSPDKLEGWGTGTGGLPHEHDGSVSLARR